jgi:hypothetical protein
MKMQVDGPDASHSQNENELGTFDGISWHLLLPKMTNAYQIIFQAQQIYAALLGSYACVLRFWRSEMICEAPP